MKKMVELKMTENNCRNFSMAYRQKERDAKLLKYQMLFLHRNLTAKRQYQTKGRYRMRNRKYNIE